MKKDTDILFDAIWELSDRSLENGLTGVAEKLEEAMDALLEAEASGAEDRPEFRSGRKPDVSGPVVHLPLTKVDMIRNDLRNLWRRMEPQPVRREAPVAKAPVSLRLLRNQIRENRLAKASA